MRELEIKIDTLQEEKINLERHRLLQKEEMAVTIRDLKSELEHSKHATKKYEDDIVNIQEQKKLIEDEVDFKKINTSKLQKNIDDIKYKNSRNYSS